MNYISEELIAPEKNLPRAITIAMASVMVLYLLIIGAYLTVLSPNGLLAADAVASALANRYRKNLLIRMKNFMTLKLLIRQKKTRSARVVFFIAIL